ncbi:MAG: hypothetical protein AMXMBFR77_24600 [Phycisphaerales bacterium]
MPEPLAPTTATISPDAISTFTSRSTTWSPNDLPRASVRTSTGASRLESVPGGMGAGYAPPAGVESSLAAFRVRRGSVAGVPPGKMLA